MFEDNNSSGIITGAYSNDGENWSVYPPFNFDFNDPNSTSAGNYPNALGSFGYPYAFWNEFISEAGNYVGKAMYTYDEAGWNGGSFIPWLEIAQNSEVISAGISNMGDSAFINIIYGDFTTDNYMLLHGLSNNDGALGFPEESVIIDSQNDITVIIRAYYIDSDGEKVEINKHIDVVNFRSRFFIH